MLPVLSIPREENLDGFNCSVPASILSLRGYWTVIGNSTAIFAAHGEVHVLIPEDDIEVASKSSSAQFKHELAHGVGFPAANSNALRGSEVCTEFEGEEFLPMEEIS